jgi:hypothetical protein
MNSCGPKRIGRLWTAVDRAILVDKLGFGEDQVMAARAAWMTLRDRRNRRGRARRTRKVMRRLSQKSPLRIQRNVEVSPRHVRLGNNSVNRLHVQCRRVVVLRSSRLDPW